MVPAGTVVNGAPSKGVTENEVPLHICWFWGGITAIGVTATVTVKGLPTQVPAAPDVGVTVYVALAELFVEFVKV